MSVQILVVKAKNRLINMEGVVDVYFVEDMSPTCKEPYGITFRRVDCEKSPTIYFSIEKERQMVFDGIATILS